MVINIDSEWRIENKDSLNFTLIHRVKLDETDPKIKNTHKDHVRGYYGNISSALKAYLETAVGTKDVVSDVQGLLEELRAAKERCNDIEDIL